MIEPLRWLRTGPHAETALALAFVVGLLATTVHWIGLVLGGVLVGLLAPSTSRATVLGFEFGLTVLVTYAAVLLWYGVLGAVFGAFPLSVGLIAIAVGLPTLVAAVVGYATALDTGA